MNRVTVPWGVLVHDRAVARHLARGVGASIDPLVFCKSYHAFIMEKVSVAVPGPCLLFVEAACIKPASQIHRPLSRGTFRDLIDHPDIGHVIFSFDDELPDSFDDLSGRFVRSWYIRPQEHIRERMLALFEQFARWHETR